MKNITINKNILSWSVFREMSLSKCERAYFYRYYASTDGWRDTADEVTKHIYRLKNIKKSQFWIKEIISKSIKTALFANCANKNEIVTGNVFTEFSKGYNSVINKAWKFDFKNLNLFEIFYNDRQNNNEILNNIKKQLKELTNTLLDSNYIKQLFEYDYIKFYDIKQPVDFHLNELQLWTTADILQQYKKNIILTNFVFSNHDSLSYQMQRLFIEYHFNIPQNKIIIANINLKDGSVNLPINKTEELLDIINNSIEKMSTFIHEDGSVCELDFLRNLKSCQFCEFKEYCDLCK